MPNNAHADMSIAAAAFVPRIALLVTILQSAACVTEQVDPPTRFRLTNGCATSLAGPSGELGFIDVRNSDGALSLKPDRAGVLLPRKGSLTKVGGDLREGEFTLAGRVCEALDGNCGVEATFVFCDVTRVGWSLNLQCLNGFGDPFCSSQLDERDVR